MGAVNMTSSSDDKDEHGCEYTASFEHYPYSETSDESFYLGRYSRSGRYSYKHDDMCRVRAKRRSLGRHRHWEINVRIGQVAHEMARDFNKDVIKEKNKIMFSVPVRAEMHSVFNEWAPVGLCLKCCRPHKKKLLVGEVILLEPYFKRRENEYFSDSSGNCENENISDIDREITQAFSHYSWHHSGERYLICGLKGKKVGEDYYFRGPAIHSNPVRRARTGSGGDDEIAKEVGPETFGHKDGGLAGIRKFFINHECNTLCENFTKL